MILELTQDYKQQVQLQSYWERKDGKSLGICCELTTSPFKGTQISRDCGGSPR